MIKNIKEYLKHCGGKDFYKFDTHEQAYHFAHEVRKQDPTIYVELTLVNVRLFLEKPKETKIEFKDEPCCANKS